MKIICTSDGVVSVFKSQCEEMPAPLSVDIRWRIVWLTLGESQMGLNLLFTIFYADFDGMPVFVPLGSKGRPFMCHIP